MPASPPDARERAAGPAPAGPFEPSGRHVTLDAQGLPADLLDDAERLTGALEEAVTDAGARILQRAVHRFRPSGVTVLLLLAESHASIHTYPEDGVLFADAFTCGGIDPAAIVAGLEARLGIGSGTVHRLERGLERGRPRADRSSPPDAPPEGP